MYVPEHFRMSDELAREMLVNSAAGELITDGAEGLQSTTVPFSYNQTVGEFGSLHTHLSRVNTQWRDSGPALVVFRGPDAFISALDYQKAQHTHDLAGSWNYLTLHVHGTLVAHHDLEWNRTALTELSQKFDPGWPLSESSEEWLEKQVRALVGVEIVITKIEGKAKLSQNKAPEDVASIADALERTGRSPFLAKYMREFALPHAQARAGLLASLRESRQNP